MAKAKVSNSDNTHVVTYQEDNGEVVSPAFPTFNHASTLLQRLKSQGRVHKYEGPGDEATEAKASEAE